MTTCLNTSASFFCAINESGEIYWLINEQNPLIFDINSPGTKHVGSGAQSVLTIPGSYAFDGASIICYYIKSTSLRPSSVAALLRVQGSLTKNDYFSCDNNFISL